MTVFGRLVEDGQQTIVEAHRLEYSLRTHPPTL
jgi:hypothetical protein